MERNETRCVGSVDVANHGNGLDKRVEVLNQGDVSSWVYLRQSHRGMCDF